MFTKKKIFKYIAIVILIKITAFGLFFMYSVESIKKEVVQKKLKINSIEVIQMPQVKALSKQEMQKQRENVVKWQLEEKMKSVYASTIKIYDKEKSKKENIKNIKANLQRYTQTNVFLASYYEKTLYGKNDYKDKDARTIVLEEIQKVRRRGGGFIVSSLDAKAQKRYILVKDLGVLELYIGINLIE
ncbi:MAG: hypothetical protein Q9M32_01080 [Sulfurimonas sp.]|nr:hypothetical protein [Sulfurimonas sp.]MDQ7059763.1 hypothetical protein [Sulfurimonas sp.]